MTLRRVRIVAARLLATGLPALRGVSFGPLVPIGAAIGLAFEVERPFR